MEQNKFLAKLTELGGVITRNVYLQGVSQGVMSMLPIIIIGAFASLFSGLPIPAWQGFIASCGIKSLLGMVVQATTNMLGVYFTFGIARSLAEQLEVKSSLAPVLAMVVYLALLPSQITKSGMAYMSFDYLGTKGMIIGILVAIFTISLFKFIVDKDITIKMPEGTPPFVARSFAALIPGFIIIIVTMIIRALFALTPYGNAFDCLYNVLQVPLTVILGGSLVSNCIIQLLTQLLWTLGIHPGFLSSMTAPIMFGLDGENQAVYAAGGEVPNIIGMAFSYSTTIAVLYAAFGLAVVIFAKSQRMKTVGKVSLVPALFGISEPLMFGLPVVLNPIIAIPWIICPMLNFVLGYAACASGIVAKYAGVTVFNFPMIATGLVNGSVSLAIMEIVLCALDIVIFMPFIKALDKQYLKDELEAAESGEDDDDEDW